MPWRPSEPGEVPTLGWLALDWITEYLAAPDRGEYEPFVPTREQAAFVLRFYELDPATARRRIRRGVVSRPRGWGKSPFLAALACLEALGPVVPDGWDASGQPVGVPWAVLRTPYVQVAAVSEAQTKNSWVPLREMLDSPTLLDAYPGVEVLDTFINLPRGRIEPVTSSARSLKGNKPVFAILDQTEEWVASNGGVHMAEVMRINAAKLNGTTVESPNAYTPGEESVAELTAQFVAKLKDPVAAGVLYDHREAPPGTDLADRESLLAGLAFAYGDSAEVNGGWMDLDRLVADIWDQGTTVQVARADFLNQITHAADAWLSQPDWAACLSKESLRDGDVVTLGFDGSVRDDASALVACRVEDGHLELLLCDEKPLPPRDRGWQVDREAFDAQVRSAMERFQVVGFYADPAHWQNHIDIWTSQYGPRMLVRANQQHPLEWWTNRPTAMVAAVDRFRDAVLSLQLSHDGDSVLSAHILNARRRLAGRTGYSIAKEHPQSRRKIDAAMAAVLAFEARSDAVARGFNRRRRSTRKRARGF